MAKSAENKKIKSGIKLRGKKVFVAVLLLIVALVCVVGGILAVSISLSARGSISASTITLNAKSTFTYDSNETTLTFTTPGEQKNITVKTENSTAAVLGTYYNLALDASGDNDLPKAILVYFNGDYIGTLAELTDGTDNEWQGSYVKKCTDSTNKPTVTDTITLELHLGASDSIYQSKKISLTTSAYTKSVDYGDYIFVEDNADLKAAVYDINSGILDGTPTIVLLNDVAFNGQTISNPFNVDLNGHILSGSVTLNGENAYLWCTGKGTNSATVELTSYKTNTVKGLLVDYAKTVLADGVEEGGKCDLFGNNKFYLQDTTNITVKLRDSSTTAVAFAQNDSEGDSSTDTQDSTGDSSTTTNTSVNYSYAGGIITASTVSRSSVEIITVCGTEIEFKVLDSDSVDTFISKCLTNIPDNTDTVVTSDLFLPTSVRSEGAIIEWTSGNPDIISDDGKIVAGKADKVEATLYAAITVNGKTTTKSFTFRVSAHTNEVNFYKMVAAMSPVVIYETVGSETTDGVTKYTTGLYDLPVVNSGGTYDYRKDYKTPSSSTLWGLESDGSIPENEERLYSHSAYSEIFLTSLTYSMLTYENDAGETKETYSHIGLQTTTDGGYQVFVPVATIENYAEIAITGTFNTGESYTSTVKVIIATGADTTVFDLAFAKVGEDLDAINVLKEILSSRTEDGIKNESGDFEMKATIECNGITFTLTYNKAKNATNADIIKKVEGTTIRIDLEKLLNEETTVPITVKATWGATSKERTLYFNVPAALHTSDLGNASIFNSVKYQVYQQLPTAEQKCIGNAFVVSDSMVANNTGDYILLRDIVGDVEYIKNYGGGDKDIADSSYIEEKTDSTSTYYVINYYYGASEVKYDDSTTSTLYAGCEELWFYTSNTNSSGYTDSAARDFAALINWATGKITGNSAATASSVITNTDKLSTTASYTQDGNEYLTDGEIAVLKEYYMKATDATETEWNTIWNQVAERAAGYVMTDGSDVEALASSLLSSSTVSNISNASDRYFKYTGVMEWATNFKDNTYNVGTDWATGVTGNPEQILYNLVFSTDTSAPTSEESTLTVTWASTSPSDKSESSATYTYIGTFTMGSATVKWYYKESKFSTGQYSRYNINSYSTDITATDSDGNTITVETLYDTKIKNYLDDDTSYITPGEAEVIFSFILSQTGVDGFKNYVKTFYESAIIPTYFTDEGISLLMDNFYSSAGISVSTDSDNDGHNDTFSFITANISTCAGTNNSGLNVTQKVTNAPAVTNLEQVSSGLSYFTQLTQLYLQGTSSLPLFLSEYGLNTAFSTAHQNSTKIATLVMEHVADNYVTFSLDDIECFTALTKVDVSDNAGVKNVNPLVNYLSDNYTYVDISNVSVGYKYYQYLLKNSKATVYYASARNSQTGSAAGVIGSLSELEDLIAENMYLATSVTDKDSGTTTNNILWRIESGNKITYVQASKQITADYTIDSADTMQSLLSPYYYCKESFTLGGTTYEAGTVLRFKYNSDGTYSVDQAVLTEVAASAESVAAPTAGDITTTKTYGTDETNRSEDESSVVDTISATATGTGSGGAGDGTGSATTAPENMTKTIYYRQTNSDGSTTDTPITVIFTCYRLYYEKRSSNVKSRYLYCDTEGNLRVADKAYINKNTPATRVCFITETDLANLGIYLSCKLDSSTGRTYFTSSSYTPTYGYVETSDTSPVSGKTYYTYANNEYTNTTDVTFGTKYYEQGYVETSDTSPVEGKTYYTYANNTYTNVSSLTSFDSSKVYYEIGYFETSDTSVDSTKTYYTYANGQYTQATDVTFSTTYYEKKYILNIGGTYTSSSSGIADAGVYFPEVNRILESMTNEKKCAADEIKSSSQITKSNYLVNKLAFGAGEKNDNRKFKIKELGNSAYLKIPTGNFKNNDEIKASDKSSNLYAYEPESSSSSETTSNATLTITYGENNSTATVTAVSFGVDIIKTVKTYTTTITETIKTNANYKYYWNETTKTIQLRTYSVASASRTGNITVTETTYSYLYWYQSESGGEHIYSFTDTSGNPITNNNITNITFGTDETSTATEISFAESKITVTVSGSSTIVYIIGTDADNNTTITRYSVTSDTSPESGKIYYTYSSESGYTANENIESFDENTTYYEAITYSPEVSYGENKVTWASVTTGETTSVYTEESWNEAKTWTCDSSKNSIYISYVPEANTTNLSNQVACIGKYVWYTGDTGTTSYYKVSTTATTSQTYTNGAVYVMGVDSSGSLTWTRDTTVSADSTQSMEGILATANTHFNDKHYGEYYGMYYAYGGTSDETYKNGKIYRIMPNSENSAFTYVTINPTDTTKYYYCTASFEYTYTNSENQSKTQSFTEGNVYAITFDDNGEFVSAKEYTASEIQNNSAPGSVEHNDNAYSSESRSITVTKTESSSVADGLIFNCFIFKNGSYSTYLFASGANQKLSAVWASNAKKYADGSDKSWNTYEACKVSFLKNDEIEKINSESNCTLGVSSLADLKCVTIAYDSANMAWSYDTTNATEYYLYFPYTMRFAGSGSSDRVSAVSNSGSAKTYYVASYTGSGKTCYLFYDSSQGKNITSSTNVIYYNNSNSQVVTTTLGNSVNENRMWTLSKSLEKSSSGGVFTNSNGICFYKYTGTVGQTSGYNSTTKSNSTTLTTNLTVTLSDGTNTLVTVNAAGLAYTITKESKESTRYTKTVVYKDDNNYYVAECSYIKINGYQAGTVTYTYIDTDGMVQTLLTTAYVGETLTYYYTDSGGSTQTTTAITITYTINGSSTTFAPSTSLDEEALTTAEYKDNIVVTPLSTSAGISDAVQLRGDFGLDYGTFYDQTYTSSDIMSLLASNSDKENAALVGQIYRLAEGSNNLQANNYVKVGGFYSVYYDEEQGTYSLKAIANVDYEVTGTTETVTKEYARLVNMRMLTVLAEKYDWKNGTNNAHTGTGGTYTVTITALLHEKVEVDSTVSGTDTNKTVTYDGTTYSIYSYTENSGEYYYIMVGGTKYKTDSKGNYIYEDTLRKYQINVVG